MRTLIGKTKVEDAQPGRSGGDFATTTNENLVHGPMAPSPRPARSASGSRTSPDFPHQALSRTDAVITAPVRDKAAR